MLVACFAGPVGRGDERGGGEGRGKREDEILEIRKALERDFVQGLIL